MACTEVAVPEEVSARPPASPPLLVFSDDWGGHPSSCQHLVRHLLPRRAVFWVNMIGMRRPGLNATTLRRSWQKLRQWLLRAQSAERAERGTEKAFPLRVPCSAPPSSNLVVLNPKLWPGFGLRAERRVNRALLLRQLRPVLEALPCPPVAVTTTPVVADLVGDLPVERWVYYCVDDFTQWPGLDHAAVDRLERKLLHGADRVIAVSEVLREKARRAGRAAELLTHGIDPEFWQAGGGGQPPSGLAELPRPLVVFWGLIDRRMDTAFVARLAAELRGGTILFVGPSDGPDPALARLPRVRVLPPVPLEELPAVAREAAVLVMPYADLPVTRAMQPLKLKEYLATGKPVVARDLPAAREWGDCLDTAADAATFARRVCERLAGGLPEAQRLARRRLARESWARKAEQFERLLGGGGD